MPAHRGIQLHRRATTSNSDAPESCGQTGVVSASRTACANRSGRGVLPARAPGGPALAATGGQGRPQERPRVQVGVGAADAHAALPGHGGDHLARREVRQSRQQTRRVRQRDHTQRHVPERLAGRGVPQRAGVRGVQGVQLRGQRGAFGRQGLDPFGQALDRHAEPLRETPGVGVHAAQVRAGLLARHEGHAGHAALDALGAQDYDRGGHAGARDVRAPQALTSNGVPSARR